MKKTFSGIVITLFTVACGSGEPVEEIEKPIDTVAIIKLEKETINVEKGLQSLEENVNNLNHEVDSLLDGI